MSRFTLALGLALGVLTVSSASAQDEPAPAAPVAPAATATTAVVPADQTTPRGAMRVLTEALQAGNEQVILQVLHATTPEEQKMAGAMADVAEAMAALQAAALGTFGEQAKGVLGDGGAEVAAALSRLAQAEEVIEGEKATITVAGEDTAPVTLTRVDGLWKLAIAEMTRDTDPQMLAQATEDTVAHAQLYRELADEITAKKYKSPEEARDALEQRLFQMLLQRQGVSTMPAEIQEGQQPAPENQPQPEMAP